MALVRLYETTGEEKYLNLAKFFVDQRGTKPYYFDKEQPEEAAKDPDGIRYEYYQAHMPVRQQEEAVGHAVRAVYLYSGMADVARLTGDEELYHACEKLWKNMTEKKMYLTGGIGGTHIGESFSFNYDLPNDTAYAETCASIGLIFMARRMLEIKPDSRYADAMELALYNTVLSGMSLDGKSFFYVNPLEVNPEACHKDERKFHVKPVRQKWFGCACCPPNLARLLSSVSSYAYTETEDTLFVHLYMGSKIQKRIGEQEAEIIITSGFPANGHVEIQVKGNDQPFTLALRIPQWGRQYKLEGAEDGAIQIKDGYLYVKKVWKEGETLKLEFPMEVQVLQADNRVRENIGKVAVVRGPVVYCLEEADNGKNLHLLTMDCSKPCTEVREEIAKEPIIAILAQGSREKLTQTDGSLYMPVKQAEKEPAELHFIPYYVWANRGENEMTVWVRRD